MQSPDATEIPEGGVIRRSDYRRGSSMRLLTITLLIIVVGNATAQERGDTPTPREAWLRSNTDTRETFVSGYQSGVLSVIEFGIDLAFNPKGILAADSVRPETRFRVQAEADTFVQRNSPQRFGVMAVAGAVTELYQDPDNSFVPAGPMVRVAIARLSGKPEAAWRSMLLRYQALSLPKR